MFLKTKFGQLHYQTFGAGSPIYFIHGLALDSNSMIPIYEPLLQAKPFKRYYLDLPGMGRSEEGQVKNSDDMLGMLAEFVAQTSENQPTILCGHSYGGYLCLGLMATVQRLAGVFVTCPVVIADERPRKIAPHHIE